MRKTKAGGDPGFFLYYNFLNRVSVQCIDIQCVVGYIIDQKGCCYPMAADKEAQKKQIGELLKNADKHIKAAEWPKALENVNKALSIEPNNMYAMAYRDRVNASIAEEKKKAEEDKVKKIAEDQKKTSEPAADEKKPESPKPEPPKKEEPQTPAPKSEPVKEETKPEPPKQETKPQGKDDSSARIDSLRQEFAATQAKLQREVAQLTMQVKEAQAMKEAVEKNLNAQIANLQHEVTAAKNAAGKANDKELDAVKKEFETFKSRHQKDIETAKEVVRGEMLAQVAILQKEAEAAKRGADNTEILKAKGEDLLKSLFRNAWQDGVISADERALLNALRNIVEISEGKFNELEKASKTEVYVNALRKIWADGSINPEESDYLTSLREKLGIPADEHFRLEAQVRKEIKH
jgi:hypothetical protein